MVYKHILFKQLTVLFLSLFFSHHILATEIYAHRGGAGLVPENTLAAIASALRIGVDVIDVDVGLTQDNVVVAHHDLNLSPNLTRTLQKTWLNSPGPAIQQLTYEELGQYDVGQMNPNCEACQQKFPLQRQLTEAKIPTLQQVIQQLKKSPQTARLQIEIKTDPHKAHSASPEAMVMALIQVLREENYASQVEVHSFDWRNLLLLQKLAPEVTTSYLSDHADLIKQPNYSVWLAGHDIVDLNMTYPKLIKKLGGSIWCPDFKELTPKLLKEAHQLGLKVNVWTVDQPKDMQTMIAYGVDGIITNRPDLLRGLLAAQGKQVPKVT